MAPCQVARFQIWFACVSGAVDFRIDVKSRVKQPILCPTIETDSMTESAETPPPEPHSKEELKRAMKAFKKRLKLTRLDDESRLGYGAMTGGGHSGVVAITPPNQYPKSVWEALADQGRLKRAGHGMYEFVDP